MSIEKKYKIKEEYKKLFWVSEELINAKKTLYAWSKIDMDYKYLEEVKK